MAFTSSFKENVGCRLTNDIGGKHSPFGDNENIGKEKLSTHMTHQDNFGPHRRFHSTKFR